MKSYLSLVAISGKVRKRQNRMTIFCIIISVLLVTAIFSVADMFIRTKSEELRHKHGNWHIQLENISQDTAEEIGRRPDVAALGWWETFNADADRLFQILKTYCRVITFLPTLPSTGGIFLRDRRSRCRRPAKKSLPCVRLSTQHSG